MTFACDCSVDHDLDTEMFRERVIKARKQHTCCECGDVIASGSLHELATGKCDGDFFSVRTCLPCSRIRADYCPGGWIYGELRERLHECLGFDYIDGEDDEEMP